MSSEAVSYLPHLDRRVCRSVSGAPRRTSRKR